MQSNVNLNLTNNHHSNSNSSNANSNNNDDNTTTRNWLWQSVTRRKFEKDITFLPTPSLTLFAESDWQAALKQETRCPWKLFGRANTFFFSIAHLAHADWVCWEFVPMLVSEFADKVRCRKKGPRQTQAGGRACMRWDDESFSILNEI